MPPVQTLFRLMAVCLVLLWVPASAHCRIEALTGAALFACAGDSGHAEDHDHPSAPADDHCGGDSCATVEDGHYRCDTQPVTTTPPVGANLLLSLLLQESPAAYLSPNRSRSIAGQPPPELSVSWQFSSRTVLPPRAPSFVS
jgi:hypothetical protein